MRTKRHLIFIVILCLTVITVNYSFKQPTQEKSIVLTVIQQNDTLSCYTASGHFDHNITKVFTLLHEVECTDAIINDDSSILLKVVTKP